VKTDRLDARVLANLLRGGYIPECYISSREALDLREMVGYRASWSLAFDPRKGALQFN